MASAVIYAIGTTSGNQPRMRRIAEKLTQTFLMGVPTMIDLALGAIKEWDGVTINLGIAGISKENASNLTTTGTKQFLTIPGAVPNQPSAQQIVRGAPYNDGRIGIELLDTDTMFYAQVGPAQTTAATDIGQVYGMTKDTDNHWFVDKNKVGANAVCQVVKLDQADTTRGVWITFLPAVQQLLS